MFSIILISWGIAFFEYMFQVPGTRIGSDQLGGPFNLFQLKIIREVITIVVFSICAIFIFKTDKFAWKNVAPFVCMLMAVYFVFKKYFLGLLTGGPNSTF